MLFNDDDLIVVLLELEKKIISDRYNTKEFVVYKKHEKRLSSDFEIVKDAKVFWGMYKSFEEMQLKSDLGKTKHFQLLPCALSKSSQNNLVIESNS